MASDLLSMFLTAAEGAPERTALVMLADGENESRVVCFEELAREVESYAAGILRRVRPGERALLLLRPGPSYVATFLGCLWAGVVPVPAYPERGSRHGERLAALIAGARPGLILVDDEPTGNEGSRDTRTLNVRDLRASMGERVARAPVASDDVAFLQFTSGSTSAPRGVAITHGNLVCNEAAIRRRFRAQPAEYSVTWLPPYHDMGLIGSLLQPLAGGMSTVLMPPTAFLQRPSRWLRAVSRYRARYSGGPTFAYALSASLIQDSDLEGVDLSSWEVAYVGAERVSAAALRAFAGRFEQHGFRASAFAPSYGLAEATLMVTSAARSGAVESVRASTAGLERGELTPATEGDKVREVVGCGEVAEGVELRIVSPETGAECPEGSVGEIWVQGPSVAPGYFEDEAATAEIFGAKLAGKAGTFLRTGDLGAVRGGQLYVTGRAKDLLIVDGRNVSPEDLEATATACDPALSPGGAVAFACELGEREVVVLALEVRRDHRQRVRAAELVAKVRSAIAEEHGVGVREVVLLRARSLPRTSSGKLRRGAARAAHLAGTLARLEQVEAPLDTDGPSRSGAEMLPLVTRLLAEQLGRPGEELDPSWSFAGLGLDSRGAVVLSGLLSRELGRELPASSCFEHPTPELLSRYLAGDARPVAAEQPESATPPPGDGTRQDIAVVGLAFRLPGAGNVDELLGLLRRGGDAVRDARPAGRPDAELPGPGGFLDDPSLFDAEHFGLLPREAERTDPQQRLVLEVAWEALESAAIAPDRLAGRPVGVFLGISGFDYSRDREASPHGATGNALSIAANRLSYFLDLRGPSLSIDTACSSSLVAVHLACQSLRRGEAELAICGGVNLLLDGAPTAALGAAGMLSPSGRCRSFDAGADGYVRGEGCILFVLKPLAAALAAGDPVLAVIRGTAVSQDGRSNGLTAPNPAAQRAVVQAAWRDAGVGPEEIGYVEAHGTGTPLGDPIEAGALAELFAGRSVACPIGSIKSNIGHLEAAAGAAGLLKAVLSVRYGEVFPVALFSAPNPALRLGGGLSIPERVVPLDGSPRIAAVSSFGFGGTNAHAVVEQPPDLGVPPATGPFEPVVLVLSARSADRLTELRERTARWLETLGDDELASACATLSLGRSRERVRAAFVVRSREQLIARLRSTAPDDGGGPVPSFEGVRRLPFGPTSPFRRRRHWLYPVRRSAASRDPKRAHPLLGRRIVGVTEPDASWFQSSVSLESDPELFDHRAYQAVVVAGASQASLLLSAHGAVLGTLPARIESLSFPQGLIVRPGETRITQLRVEKPEFGRATFRWLSFADAPGVTESQAVVHAVGHFPISKDEPVAAPSLGGDLAAIRARCTSHLDQAAFYRLAESHNIQFGPSYRWNEEVWAGTGEALSRLVCPAGLSQEQSYELHPGLLDSCFQLAAATGFDRGDEAFILFRIRELTLFRAPRRSETLFAHAVRHTLSAEEDIQKVSLRLFDERGDVVCEARDVELHRASIQGFLRSLQPDSLRELVYGVDFEPLPGLELGERLEHLLVVGGAGPTSDEVVRALRARSLAVSLLPLGAGSVQESALSALREQIRRLVPAEGAFGLVFVATEPPEREPASEAELWSAQAGGCLALASVIRALLMLGRQADVRLRVVARGSMPEAPGGSAQTFPVHAPLRGLLKTLGAEHPGTDVRLLDVEGKPDPERLAAALLGEGNETEIALRPDAAHVPRLVHRRVDFVTHTLKLDPDASYLVTGGTGALGLTVARFLCSRGARHLALLARSRQAVEDRRELEDMVRMGVEVQLLQADVADGDALSRALSQIRRPLRGVVHAAGVLDDAFLPDQTLERAERVLSPKLLGTFNVERLTRDQPLDFLLLFSSIASLFGSPGQASYAAGNAFLDALSAHRGKGTVSVWWGPWAEIGMAARQGEPMRARLSRLGLTPLEPSLGSELTEQLLRSAHPQVAVAAVDWQRFFSGRARVPALFQRLYQPGAAGASDKLRHELLARVRASDEEQGALLLTETLCGMIAEAAEAPPEAIDHSRSLNELGLDSLIALNVQTRIEEELGIKVPITRFMESVSARQLSRELLRELGRAPSAAPAPAVAQVAAVTVPHGGERPPPAREARAVSGLVPSARSARKLDVSLFYFSRSAGHEHLYRLLTEGARFADEQGLCAVWVPERHFHEFGGPYPNPALLAAHLAAITRRVRLRAGSVVLPLHHPLRVAEEWAVVDRLSGGRVDISVVRGWGPNDFALAPGDFAGRTRILEQKLDQLRRLWRGEALTFENGVGQPAALTTFPRPVQPELDAWLTCTREDERFVEAGTLGTNVLTALLLQSPEELERRIGVYRAARAKAGHPGDGKVTLMLHTFIGDDAAEVKRTVRGPLEEYLRSSFELWRTGSATLDTMSETQREQMLEYALERYTATSSLLGSYSDCLRTARRFQRMGVDEFACLVDFGVDDELVLSGLRYLPELQAALNVAAVEAALIAG